MDGHKLHWHLDRVTEWQAGKRIAPLHIDMGISRSCNMACCYCYGVIQGRTGHGTEMKKNFNMPKDVILRTFDDAKNAGIRSIALIGEGENTLNPALYDAVDFARSIKLDLGLATNGLIVVKSELEKLLRGLVWLRVNISAGEREAFKKIHNVDGFDRVCENVKTIISTRNRLGLKTTVGLQMVVVGENFDQILPLARLGRELCVDYLVIKPCSDTGEKTLGAPTTEYLGYNNVYEVARSLGTEKYSVIPKVSKLMNVGKKDYDICYGTQFLIAVSAEGGVYPCGHWFNVEREKFLMGNVLETRFRDIIASQRYWEVQERVRSVNVHCDCESNCRQHYINGYLSHLMSPPDHVNFI